MRCDDLDWRSLAPLLAAAGARGARSRARAAAARMLRRSLARSAVAAVSADRSSSWSSAVAASQRARPAGDGAPGGRVCDLRLGARGEIRTGGAEGAGAASALEVDVLSDGVARGVDARYLVRILVTPGSFMRHIAVAALLLVASSARAQSPAPQPVFTYQQVMIPMRDGVHLQTVILTPVGKRGPLPILFRRTPYGVPDSAPTEVAREPQGARCRRIHLRHSESARTLQVGRRVQAHVAGEPRRLDIHERDDRRVRQHRLAREERRRTTTARSGCTACRTTGSRPRWRCSIRIRRSRR